MKIELTEQELSIVIQCVDESIEKRERYEKSGPNYVYRENGRTYFEFLTGISQKLEDQYAKRTKELLQKMYDKK
jgi:hypothetical protein